MSDREPGMLRDPSSGPVGTEAADTEPTRAPPAAMPKLEPPTRPSGRGASTVHVVGFWKRAVAALIDWAIVLPVALLMTWIVSKIAGVSLPPIRLAIFNLSMWLDVIDRLLSKDSAFVMTFVMITAIGLIYLLVFHIVLGQTLGMRVMKMRIVDVYGDRPSPLRCIGRCAGYLASALTMFLGFLWIAVDSEKRGLQDWIAGTYVIRA